MKEITRSRLAIAAVSVISKQIAPGATEAAVSSSSTKSRKRASFNVVPDTLIARAWGVVPGAPRNASVSSV
jgi:hypothetical protein